MFSWPDCIAVLGFIALAILGGYLGVLPSSLVTAMVTASAGYFVARTAILKLKKNDKKLTDKQLTAEGGVPLDEGGGVVEIAKQQSSRIQIHSDGSVTIGPAPGEDPSPHDDDTPPDTKLPDEKKDDSDAEG